MKIITGLRFQESIIGYDSFTALPVKEKILQMQVSDVEIGNGTDLYVRMLNGENYQQWIDVPTERKS